MIRSKKPSREEFRAGVARLKGKGSITLTGERGWDPITNAWLSSEQIFNQASDAALATVYSKSDIIFACVREIQTAFCAAPLQVGNETEEGFKPNLTHEALRLFYENPDYDYATIFQLIAARLYLTGASFSLKGGFEGRKGVATFTPMPTHVVNMQSNGPAITGYEVRKLDGGNMRLKPEEVAAIMFPDPLKYRGFVSPLAAAQREYLIDRERQNLTAEVMRNRKVPGGFLSTDQPLTKIQREELRKGAGAAMGAETEGRGSLVVLPQGIKYSGGTEVSDIDFGVLASMSETRICAVFGVPPIIIGLKSGLERSTFANYMEARKSFYAETIQPLWGFVAEALTRSLLAGVYGEDYFQFDSQGVKELQEDAVATATRASVLYEKGVAKRNEARAMVGLPQDEADGDAYKVQVTPQPFGQGSEETVDIAGGGPEGKSKGRHRRLWTPGGGMGEGKDAPDYVGQFKARPAVGHFAAWREMEGALRRVFDAQEKDVIDELPGEKYIPDIEKWNKSFANALRPVLAGIYKRNAERILRRVKAKRDARKLRGKDVSDWLLAGGFDVINEETLIALEIQLREFAQSVNLTTAKNLERALDRVVQTAIEKHTLPDLIAAVKGVFIDAKEYRAKMIAITESSRATHDGQILAAKQTGVVRGFKTLIAPDACEICQFYDQDGLPTGVAVTGYQDINEAAAGVGIYGHAPPWHPNCRCSQIEVLDVDEEPEIVAIEPGWWNLPRPGREE